MGEAAAVDTNVLVASLVVDHVHYAVASEAAADASHVLGQVAVEAWSVLRRRFRLPVDTVAPLLTTYVDARQLVSPSSEVYRTVLSTGRTSALGGDVHDAVIVRTAEHSGLELATLDQGLHRLADGLITCRLLPEAPEP